MQFKQAKKTQAKLRLTLDGPAGSGKTYSSLLIAKTLGGKVALIDTEHGSASKYADIFAFDTLELREHSLQNYIEAIGAAAKAGYEVLVIDSLSHAWAGKGGALEQVDKVGSTNKFAKGWSVVTPLQNRLVDSILGFPGHVIATMRTKTEYVIEQENGKSVPRKVGMAPVQRDGVEYEFDVVADLSINGVLTVTKTRCPKLTGAILRHAEVEGMAQTLKAWLSDGVEPEKAPVDNPFDEPSEEEKMLVRIDECRSVEELKSLVSAIKAARLDGNETVRSAYAKRQGDLAVRVSAA